MGIHRSILHVYVRMCIQGQYAVGSVNVDNLNEDMHNRSALIPNFTNTSSTQVLLLQCVVIICHLNGNSKIISVGASRLV